MKIFKYICIVLTAIGATSCCATVDCFECATPQALVQPVFRIDSAGSQGYSLNEIRAFNVLRKDPFNDQLNTLRINQDFSSDEYLISMQELRTQFVFNLTNNFTPYGLFMVVIRWLQSQK